MPGANRSVVMSFVIAQKLSINADKTFMKRIARIGFGKFRKDMSMGGLAAPMAAPTTAAPTRSFSDGAGAGAGVRAHAGSFDGAGAGLAQSGSGLAAGSGAAAGGAGGAAAPTRARRPYSFGEVDPEEDWKTWTERRSWCRVRAASTRRRCSED